MILTNENIFSEVKRIILEACDVISAQAGVMKKDNPYTQQRVVDIKQGLVRLKNNLLVFLKDVEHKILFEGYEIHALEVFVTLCKEILENIDSSIAQFSLRTLLEMSFEKIRILFDSTLSIEDKKKYKATCLLADYGFMKDHARDYDRLLNDFKGSFTGKQLALLKDLRISVLKGTERPDLIKNIRSLINQLQVDLIKSSKQVGLFGISRVNTLNSSLSHLLHGDFTLISSLFLPQRSVSNKLRIYTITMIAVVNVVSFLTPLLVGSELKDKAKNIQEEGNRVLDYLAVHWRAIESHH